jgi:hypothetical protein
MNLAQRLYIIGCMLFIWYACMVIFPQITLLMGSTFSWFQFLGSNICFLILWFLIQRKYFLVSDLKNNGFFLLVFSLIIYACLWYANTILDCSFDGNWYHLDAIHLLNKGWNPIYSKLQETETSFSFQYLAHFPKGSWLFGANLLAFSGEAELGKASTQILSISLFLLSTHTCKEIFRLNYFSSFLIGLLTATNPIILLNFGNHYADGQLAALLCIGIIFSIQEISKGNPLNGILALLAFALLANTKYNGTAYAILFTGVFLCYAYKFLEYPFKKIALIGMVWVFASFFLLGYNPFISNTIEKAHPFYPLNTGTQSVFNVAHNYPANFIQMNRFEKFLASLYAQPDWAIQPKSSTIKKLFSPISFESYSFGNSNLAGFGPFLPEVLLFLIPLGIWVFLGFEPKKRYLGIGFIVIILFSIFINPESWVMRYVPQFWLIPIVLLLFLIQHKKSYLIGIFMSIILLTGNGVLGYHYLMKCHIHTKELINQVELVRHSKGAFMYDGGWSKPFQYRIEKLGLDLGKQEKLSKEDSLVKPFTGGLGAYFKKRTNK